MNLERLVSAKLQVLLLPPASPGELPAEIAANRTRRSLAAAGIDLSRIIPWDPLRPIESRGNSLLVIRSGIWLRRPGPLNAPPDPGVTPRFAAVGLPGLAAEQQLELTPEIETWQQLQARSGGDFEARGLLPLPPVLWLNAAAATEFLAAQRDRTRPEAVWKTLQRSLRIVRWAGLDSFTDARIRVLELITSLQRGGAERLALDLVLELRRQGTPTALLGLGRPTRAAFRTPTGWWDLRGQKESTQRALVRQVGSAFGADLFHAHLMPPDLAEEMATLSPAPSWPLVQTLHNTRPGWPPGLAEFLARPTPPRSTFIACSQAAEYELQSVAPSVHVRTIWNGIDADSFRLSPNHQSSLRAPLRERLHIPPDDLVLIAIANPRPQKRLERLPAILAHCRARLQSLGNTDAWLVLVGSASKDSTTAQGCVAAIHAAAAQTAVTNRIHWAGDAEDVRPWLAAADVLVNVSDHEGLSLAQLEALAAGLPVVVTAVGGALELAAQSPRCHVLADVENPEAFAQTILQVTHKLDPPASRPDATPNPPEAPPLPASFTLPVMTARHRFHFERLLVRSVKPASPRRGLCLVTNNFSVGGAQSSARRLLLELAQSGQRVFAVTLQEYPDQPSPGTAALRAAGIPVHALPPPETIDALTATTLLLRRLDAEAPVAVMAWNALAEYKLRLAEALDGLPFFDVSPGEMYFASLERLLRRPPPGLLLRDAAEYGRRLSGVIVKYAAESARAATLGAPVQVIPNGVPLLPLAPRKPGEVVVFGTAARLNPHKRLDLLLAAFRRALPHLPPSELLIAGDAEDTCSTHADELKALARDLPVRFLGEVAEIPAFLHRLDVFAMISEPAGCPNASLEAMSAGLPVIATNHGGASEQVVDGLTGRLVEREDIAGLASSLVSLAHDPHQRHAMGSAGRRRIEEQFSLPRMVQRYRDVLGL